MQNSSRIPGNVLWQTLASLLVAIVTLKPQNCVIRPGLDETYIWPLNTLPWQSKQLLSGITYSYGPLCLLKWPIATGDHILISALAYLLGSTVFVFILTELFKHTHQTRQIAAPLLASALCLLVINVDYLYVGVVASALLLYKYKRVPAALWVALIFTVAGCYIRTTLMVFVLCTWVAWMADMLLQKHFRPVLLVVVLGPVLFLLTGTLFFASASGAWQYGVNNLHMAFGFTDVLTLYPENDATYILLTLGALAAVLLYYFKKPAGYVMLLMGLTFFANWKYSFTFQEFWHSVFFLYLIVLAFTLVWVVQADRKMPLVILFLLAISTYAHSVRKTQNFWENLLWFPDISTFDERVLHHADFKNHVLSQSRELSSVNILPQKERNMIGNATVDVLPYDLSYAWINELNYRPRPTLQLALFGKDFDKRDAAFYASAQAPEYLIWHNLSAGKTQVDGILNNYLPNAAPATIDAILSLYEPTVFTGKQYTIWKKKAGGKPAVFSSFGNRQAAWDDWIQAPPFDSLHIYRVRADIQPGALYQLRSALYRGVTISVEYELENGNMYHYSIAPSMAADAGVLVQPLLTAPDKSFSPVSRFRFVCGDGNKKYFDRQLQLSTVSMRYSWK